MNEIRESFGIPPEARQAVTDWIATLPESTGDRKRFVWSFFDNGIVDEITVTDIQTGSKFEWVPPFEQW